MYFSRGFKEFLVNYARKLLATIRDYTHPQNNVFIWCLTSA